jgi:hypothetical protein
MVIRIREIASTLIESEDGGSSNEKQVWMKEQNKHCVTQFVEILTSLEQASIGCFEDLSEEKSLVNC